MPVAPSVPAEHVACFANAYITAWEMLVTKAGVGPDDVVFVWAGTSGLGSAAIEIAKLVGARVIASAGTAPKLEALAGRTADLIVDHHRDDVVGRVLDFTDGLGASIVFEHVGAATWQRSLEMCASGGDDRQRRRHQRRRRDHGRHRDVRQAGAHPRLAPGHDGGRARRHPPLRRRPVPAAWWARSLALDQIAEGHRMLERGDVAGKIVVRL